MLVSRLCWFFRVALPCRELEQPLYGIGSFRCFRDLHTAVFVSDGSAPAEHVTQASGSASEGVAGARCRKRGVVAPFTCSAGGATEDVDNGSGSESARGRGAASVQVGTGSSGGIAGSCSATCAPTRGASEIPPLGRAAKRTRVDECADDVRAPPAGVGAGVMLEAEVGNNKSVSYRSGHRVVLKWIFNWLRFWRGSPCWRLHVYV
jgi:hypothetical protein